jgi:hypothetical protein
MNDPPELSVASAPDLQERRSHRTDAKRYNVSTAVFKISKRQVTKNRYGVTEKRDELFFRGRLGQKRLRKDFGESLGAASERSLVKNSLGKKKRVQQAS